MVTRILDSSSGPSTRVLQIIKRNRHTVCERSSSDTYTTTEHSAVQKRYCIEKQALSGTLNVTDANDELDHLTDTGIIKNQQQIGCSSHGNIDRVNSTTKGKSTFSSICGIAASMINYTV